MKSWFNSPVAQQCQGYLCNWMALGYFIFPLAIYLNPSKGGTANIFYLGVLLPWLMLLLMGRVSLWYKNSAYIVAVLLFFYLWLNALWGDKNTLADIAYLFKWFVYALCLLTAPILIVKRFPDFFERLLLFIFVASVVAAIVTIFVHIRAHGSNFYHIRLISWGFGYNPIGFGLHHGLAVLAGLFLVDRYKTNAVWFALASLLPLAAMMLSNSRGPIVALLLCGVMALFVFERSKTVVLTKLAFLGFIIAAVIFVGWDFMLARGFSGRPQIWGQVWELIKQSVTLGEGFSLQSSRVLFNGIAMSHSHNVILELLRYGGLIAVALFLVHLITLYRFQIASTDKVSGYYLIMLSFTLIVMLTNGWYLLDRPNYFWPGYWYPVGLLIAKKCAAKTASN